MTDNMNEIQALPLTIDVGGELYYLGTEKPVELAYKSRKDFLNNFSNNPSTEYLLRKYLYSTIQPRKPYRFDSEEEKAKLLQILEARANKIKSSMEFTSSVLKNTQLQRVYLGILNLIQDIKGPQPEPWSLGITLPNVSEGIVPCKAAQKYIKESKILEDKERVYRLVLEMAWFLLHPEAVPKDTECEWARLVKKLDQLRIGDIRSTSIPDKSAPVPLNHFKAVNLDKIKNSDKLNTLLDEAKAVASKIEGGRASTEMKNRVESVLKVTEFNKFLNKSALESDTTKIIDVSRYKFHGGNQNSVLNKSMAEAIRPLFSYFKITYDPIYSLLESSIKQNSSNLEKILLPQLSSVLHICNNLPESDCYGVYKVTNVDQELITFFNRVLNATSSYLNKLEDDKERNLFNKQVSALPKMRLTTFLRNYTDGYRDRPDTYIQFFILGNNLIKPTEKKTEEKTLEALNNFFVDGNLYVVCSKANSIFDNIPLRVSEIKFSDVDITDNNIQINKLADNYFNKNKFQLDDLLELKRYTTYNEAELALSVFIGLKELISR
jgi:hypothetical protein